MSWRFIFAVLLVAIGASAWGGLRLGDWLVAHGPAVPVVAERSDLSAVPVLDANGRPFVAQPPQPLVDGRLAIPEPVTEVAWKIPEKSLDDTKANQVIAVATTPITMVEAQKIAASDNQKLSGIGDVGDLMQSGSASSGPRKLQPIEANEPAPAPAPALQGNAGAWQASLRQDLQACSAESFFDRPSCAWAARNKYCTPNNAWGQTRDCPPKSF